MTGDTVTVARRSEQVIGFRTPRGYIARMTIREGTNDWNTLNACMTEDEYGLRDWRGEGWALDIGGYLGGVAIGLALDNPNLRVICVEPVPDNARLIRENVERNGVADRVTVIENAVGGHEPVTVMFNYRGSELAEHHAFVGNSTLAYEDSTEGHDSLEYPHPETLWSLMERAGAERLTLVKIDTEGAEWAFLDSAAVSYVDRIVGEWHPVKGHVQSDVLGLLGATHDVTFSGPIEGPGGFVAVRR